MCCITPCSHVFNQATGLTEYDSCNDSKLGYGSTDEVFDRTMRC